MAKKIKIAPLTAADEQLLRACADGDLGRVIAAVSAGAKLDREGEKLPLLVVARRGYTKVFRWLLEHGADPKRAEPSGDTALFEAAKNNFPAIIELCLEFGDVVTREDQTGQTPLMVAVAHAATAVVKLLLDKGASAHTKSVSGDLIRGTTALLVVGTMHPKGFSNGAAAEILNLLYGAGVDGNVRNQRGESLLHIAARNRDAPNAILALIFAMGLEVDAHDACGCTPLWHAARANAHDHVTLLLASGADATVRSTKTNDEYPAGTSVLDAARERGDLKLLSALRAAGATVIEAYVERASIDPLAVGATVTHTRFGDGQIVAVDGVGADCKLTILFGETSRVLQAKFVVPKTTDPDGTI